MPATDLATAIRDSGLVSESDRGVVMVSGGADSVALLTGLAEVLGAGNLVVLHVNYGLRDAAEDEEELVRGLCRKLGVDLEVHRAGAAEGNVQDWARQIRHREAERIRVERDFDWIAVGHSRSDLAETFLYRLASSPGVKSLLAMPPRSGNLIRPLLALRREEIRDLLEGVAAYADDESNDDPSYARNRIRLEVIPALERVNPAVELNIARTRDELREDEDALVAIAAQALDQAAADPSEDIPGALLANLPPAIVRRLLRLVAESVLGRPVAVSRDLTADAMRLSRSPEGGMLDLGGGQSLLFESGSIRVLDGTNPVPGLDPGPVETGEGTTGFGGWEIAASQTTESEARQSFGNPWVAFLDPGPAVPELRSWQAGDRIEPLGMSGSKKLQDVFTDALVPASKRHTWPVLVVGSTVVWVPGLVRSRHLLISDPDKPVLRLEATPPFPS